MLNGCVSRRNSGCGATVTQLNWCVRAAEVVIAMIEYLGRLLAYDEWANREVLGKLEASGGQPPRSLKLMAHILSAERLWLERLQAQPQSLPVWPEFMVQECRAHAEELPGLWRGYLAKRSDLDSTV